MFTKIVKVELWIGIIGGIIASVVLGLRTDNFLIGMLTIIGGVVGTFVLFCFLGMLVEVSENINKSRETLFIIKNKEGSGLRVSDYWVCRLCGEKNDRLTNICKGCGQYK